MTDLYRNLQQFIGSETATLYMFLNRPMRVRSKSFGVLHVSYTEGVAYLAKHAKCYWLIDAIASHLPKVLQNEACETLTVWTLTKKDDGAILAAKVDTKSSRSVVTQKIAFTDFPFDETGVFKLYGGATTIQTPQGVLNTYNILLPSEY